MFQLIGDFLFLEQGFGIEKVVSLFFAIGIIPTLFLIVLLPTNEKCRDLIPFLVVPWTVTIWLTIFVPESAATFESLAASVVNEPNITLKECILENTLEKFEGNKADRISYSQFSDIRELCKTSSKGQ